MAETPQLTLDPNSPVLRQLHEVLLASGYCESGIAPNIEGESLELPESSADATPLNTLIRLFFMSENCQTQNVAEAIRPLALEQLLQARIVRMEGELVAAAIRVQPYGRTLFLFDRDVPGTAPEETLMLITPSSLEVAHLVTRRPVRTALDIGTGSGFLATVLAPFSEKVCAIDLNPAAIRAAEFNALWNNLENISFLAGNLLEPIRGRRFNLIVSNPPFLITPVPTVFSARYIFKHSGLPGDTFCINLAREASQLLEEEGYFHMMFQWEEPNGEAWSSRLEKSFSGLGCDVWVARILTTSTEQYVSEWVESLSEAERANSEIITQEARQYFQEKNVAATGMGLLTMRRASHRQNYLWFDEAPEDRGEPYGENVAALFDTRVHLMQVGDAGLLQERLRPSPHLGMLQNSDLKLGEWVPTATELQLRHGLKYSFGDVHPEVIKLLTHFDGIRTVQEVFALRPKEDHPSTPEAIEQAITAHLPAVRDLLWYGFLMLA